MWYSLRSFLAVTKPADERVQGSHETSPLSKPEVPDTIQLLCGNVYSFWILPNPVGQARKIPLQGVWSDFLPEQRHCLSPAPTSPSYIRSGCRSQRRGMNKSA